MTQLKDEKLMVVLLTAEGITAEVCTLRSLDGKDGVNFHTFKLTKVRCVPLMVKNLGRGLPQYVVQEELQSMNILSWESLSSVPAVANSTPPRTTHPPALHCISGARA